MPHWKLTLSYDGSHLHGWQVQPGLSTIQGTLAQAIAHVTGETVLPQGSGRTDTGVHALAQVASFSLQAGIPAANLQRALNRVLPQSIRILAADEAPESFHARHSARRKMYEYRIFERRVQAADEASVQERVCSPFLAPYVWDCRWPLSFGAMQAAAAQFVGTHDFTAFAATDPERPLREPGTPDSRPNPVKTIYASAWARQDGALVYRVTGSGFLHHMVRNLVGTMVDVGRGSLTADAIPQILASRNRAQAGPTAPARGLFLREVMYEAQDESEQVS